MSYSRSLKLSLLIGNIFIAGVQLAHYLILRELAPSLIMFGVTVFQLSLYLYYKERV